MTPLRLVPKTAPVADHTEHVLATLQEAFDDIRKRIEKGEVPDILMVVSAREVPVKDGDPNVGLSWWMTDNPLLEKLGLLVLLKNDLSGMGYDFDPS